MSGIQNNTQNKELIPKVGVILYQSKLTKEIEYIEKIDFVKSQEGYQIKTAKPFSFTDMSRFSSFISRKSGLYMEGLIPKEILFYDTSNGVNKVIWFVPAGKRQLNFQDKKLSGIYEIPNMIFVSIETELYVYLIKAKDSKAISKDTKLYQTHFYNVYERSNVCIGNGYKPSKERISIPVMIRKIEVNFFTASIFTHAHTNSIELENVWKKENGLFPEKKWKELATIGKWL